MVFVFGLFLHLPSFSFCSFFVSLFVFFSLLVCLFVLRMTRRVHYLLHVTAMIIELFFYLGFLGFSFTNIHDSQDSRGRERLFP